MTNIRSIIKRRRLIYKPDAHIIYSVVHYETMPMQPIEECTYTTYSQHSKEILGIEDMTDKTEDAINHPSYYNRGKFEVVVVMEDWMPPQHLFTVIPYIARAGKKAEEGLTLRQTEIKDCKKGVWWTKRYIKFITENDHYHNWKKPSIPINDVIEDWKLPTLISAAIFHLHSMFTNYQKLVSTGSSVSLDDVVSDSDVLISIIERHIANLEFAEKSGEE